MADLLVKLYDLKQGAENDYASNIKGVEIRRPLVAEKMIVSDWVKKCFGRTWASECEVSFCQQPVACWIALRAEKLIGFACYNTTFKGFFGPIGIEEHARSQGIGKGLLIAGLHAMAQQGYAYAVIGGAGPVDFFQRCVPLIEIPDSSPGPYRGLLRPENQLTSKD